MGLLDLVEQDDTVGLASDGFRQSAAFAIANIAGRCSLEKRNGVALLKLAHVDRDDVLLAAVKRLRERKRRLRFADTGRPAQHENPDRFVRIVQLRPVRLDPPCDHGDPGFLTDDPAVQDFGQIENSLNFVAHHPADGNSSPGRDNRGHRLLIDMRIDHALIRVDPGQASVEFAQVPEIPRGGLRIRLRGARFAIAPGSVMQGLPGRDDLVNDRLFPGEFLFAFNQRSLFLSNQLSQLLNPIGRRYTKFGLVFQCFQLFGRSIDRNLDVRNRGRRGRLADGNPRAGRIEEVDSLVWQLARGNIARGKLDGSHKRGVGNSHP